MRLGRHALLAPFFALVTLLLGASAEASLARTAAAEFPPTGASPPIERVLTLGESAAPEPSFELFEGTELARAAAAPEGSRSFHPLAAVSLLDERLKADLAAPLEPSYPKTRYRVFEFLGTPILGVERGVSLELHWGSNEFRVGLASGTVGWLSEDPLGPIDSPNLYGYVGLRPHEKTDPLGLAGDCPPGQTCMSAPDPDRGPRLVAPMKPRYQRAEDDPCKRPPGCWTTPPGREDEAILAAEDARIEEANRAAYRWKFGLYDVPNVVPALIAPKAGATARAIQRAQAPALPTGMPARISRPATSPESVVAAPPLLPSQRVAINRGTGDAFERRVVTYKRDTQDDVAEQLYIRPNTPVGPADYTVRVDAVGKEKGTQTIRGTEAKSSETAPLTTGQRAGYPLITRYGGTVVGDSGGRTYPAGTVIPPGTQIDIVRPHDLPAPY